MDRAPAFRYKYTNGRGAKAPGLFAQYNGKQPGPMHRYRDDSVITYSADDLVLFLESPFAAWMERLTLEHPDHGIPPDPGSRPPENSASPQHAFSATLRVSGRDFVRVDWEQPEPQRVAATLEAMRGGADFIVDGQLAAGVLSGPANLLMRTGGFSDFGDYLYLPCATGCEYDHRAAFRLCFLADLLLAVQGQLPPKLLQVRDESDLSALATGSHIHYYRAVKERFLRAQREFRRDRMPDPAESSHCGRWHDCANEVIRQRLQRRPADGAPSTAPRAPAPEAGAPSSSPNPPWWRHYVEPVDRGGVKPAPRTGEGATLAEQARELAIEMGAAERGAVERVEERGKVGGEARGEVRGEEGAEVEAGGGPDDSPRLQLLRFIGESDGPSPLL